MIEKLSDSNSPGIQYIHLHWTFDNIVKKKYRVLQLHRDCLSLLQEKSPQRERTVSWYITSVTTETLTFLESSR